MHRENNSIKLPSSGKIQTRFICALAIWIPSSILQYLLCNFYVVFGQFIFVSSFMLSSSLVQLDTTRNYIAVEEKFLGFVLVYELACTELLGSGSLVKRIDPFCAINQHDCVLQLGCHSVCPHCKTFRQWHLWISMRGSGKMQHSTTQQKILKQRDKFKFDLACT